MSASIIAEFVGSLLLALLTGTWNPLPADRISDVLPAPVAFTAEWHPGASDHRSNSLIVLDDGSTRLGGTSSIVSPRRTSGLAAGN